MKQLGLASRIRRKKTKQSMPKTLATSNILERNFHAENPNEKMGTDITTVSVCGLKRHVAVVIDFFNNEVVSYQVAKHNNLDLVVDAVKGVIATRDCSNLILHSDRGSQYRSFLYSDLLADYNITVSMSGAGCPGDNAVVESFFSHLKTEWFYNDTFDTEQEFLEKLQTYLIFYNNERFQSRLQNLSPVDYRLKMAGN